MPKSTYGVSSQGRNSNGENDESQPYDIDSLRTLTIFQGICLKAQNADTLSGPGFPTIKSLFAQDIDPTHTYVQTPFTTCALRNLVSSTFLPVCQFFHSISIYDLVMLSL